MTIENIAIDHEYNYAFDNGQVIIVYRNQVIALGNFQGSKVLIAAVNEIEELRHQIGNRRLSAITSGDDAPVSEDVEDGKYTIVETDAGVEMLRHSQPWIDEDRIEQPALWVAIGRQLQALRDIAHRIQGH